MNSEAASRFKRNRPAVFGLWLTVLLMAFCWIGPLFLGTDPNASDFSLTRDEIGAPPGPSAAHWLGTDALFRDVLARLAYGGRLSLTIAVFATALSMTIGTTVGVLAGMTADGRFRWVDSTLMRIVEVLLALPFLLVVTAVGVAIGQASAWNILFILGMLGWTGTARVVRAKTMQVRNVDHVTAGRALGASPLRLVFSHVLPNVSTTLIVLATSAVAQMILAEAVLGYLAIGVAPPTPSWGRMLHESESFIGIRLDLVAAPAFAILLAVLGWNRIGDGLRDVVDPRRLSTVLPHKRRLPIDLLLIGCAVALVAFASPDHVRAPLSSAASVTPRTGGWLRVATFTNIRHLDAALAYDEASRAMGDVVYEQLVTWDEQGRIKPQLAESYEVLDNGLKYRFVLRPGVKFHDGATLAARDVKRSIERTLHPDTPSPGAQHYRMIKGFDAYRNGDSEDLSGIRVFDNRTVEFNLSEPNNSFLPLLTMAFAAPVCPSLGRTVDAAQPPLPCGTGPFRAVRFDPESAARFERHTEYRIAGRPYLDGIDWMINVPPRTQRYKLEDGALDFVRDLSANDAALFRSDAAWKPQSTWVPKRATNGIFMNTQMPPFDNRHLRKAVYHAIDPTVLTKVHPAVAALDRILPPSVPGPERTTPMRTFDIDLALSEMEAAGYPFDPLTGEGGYPEEIDYVTVPGSFEQVSAEVFQQQLARIGIRIRLRLVSFATYLAEVARPDTARMGWVGWAADYPDALNFYEPTLTSAAIDPEHSQNYAFFQNAEFDAVVTAARRESNPERRLVLLARIEEILRDEAPWVPTYVGRVNEIWQPYVRGYRSHPVLGPQLADVWLDPVGSDTVEVAP